MCPERRRRVVHRIQNINRLQDKPGDVKKDSSQQHRRQQRMAQYKDGPFAQVAKHVPLYPGRACRFGQPDKQATVLADDSFAPLAFEQRQLAFHAPAIAGNRAIAAHHAVARNGDGDGIGSAGLSHGPHRFR